VGPEENVGSGEAGPRASVPTTEFVSPLRAFIEDGGAGSEETALSTRPGDLRFPKVHPAEISKECLETLDFRPTRELAGSADSAEALAELNN
jgi:hypothetical protein